MKASSGKYMFIGNVNSLFGVPIRYAESIKSLKLNASDKEDAKKGESSIFVSRDGKICRINANGRLR